MKDKIDMEPTKEQVQWFWEQCGFRRQQLHELPPSYNHEGNLGWWYPDGKTSRKYLLDIDLNNLFKYAVPKARKLLNAQSEIKGIDTVKYPFHDLMKRWVYAVAIKNEDPALALFWAIYKAFEGG